MTRTLLISLGFLIFSHYANAEVVTVKYRGAVPLDDFSCHNTDSSFVHRICFDETNQYIVVLLKNTYYHYCRIPANVVNSWLSAPSVGRFYMANIKGQFDCRLGGVPEY